MWVFKEHIEYHYFDDDEDGMPIITLEVLPDSTIVESGTLPDGYYNQMESSDAEIQELVDRHTKAGLILNYMNATESNLQQETYEEYTHSNMKNMILDMDSPKNMISKVDKQDESKQYSTRSDSSIHCNICGKIYANLQYWLRHKYKVHANHPPVDSASLFKCDKCLIYFKSRKGFLGHMSSKHSEILQDATPVLNNEQNTTLLKELESGVKRQVPISAQRELDPETITPKTPTVQNCAVSPTSAVRNITRSTDKKTHNNDAKAPDQLDEKEYQEKRDKDTKFVMNIIDRVKREFTNKPAEVSGRRGYTRKSYATKNRQ